MYLLCSRYCSGNSTLLYELLYMENYTHTFSLFFHCLKFSKVEPRAKNPCMILSHCLWQGWSFLSLMRLQADVKQGCSHLMLDWGCRMSPVKAVPSHSW